MQLEKIILNISHFFHHLFNSSKRRDNFSNELMFELEKKFEYHFVNTKIIIQALKHRSFLAITGEERLSSNERLELLGDSVLGLAVTDYLYKKFPNKEEGELTAMKSLIVSRKVLAKVANDLNLGKYILLNEAEEKAGGRKRPSIIADAFEAIVGAIYLDGGLEQAISFIKKNVLSNLDEILNEEQNQNFKSILLEYSQSKNYGLPIYIVKNEQGPDHKKVFTIEVKVNDQVQGIGKGNSKKKAEQMAAKDALKKMSLI